MPATRKKPNPSVVQTSWEEYHIAKKNKARDEWQSKQILRKAREQEKIRMQVRIAKPAKAGVSIRPNEQCVLKTQKRVNGRLHIAHFAK